MWSIDAAEDYRPCFISRIFLPLFAFSRDKFPASIWLLLPQSPPRSANDLSYFPGNRFLPSLSPSRALSAAPLKSVDLLREMDDFGFRQSAHARTGSTPIVLEHFWGVPVLPEFNQHNGPPTGCRWYFKVQFKRNYSPKPRPEELDSRSQIKVWLRSRGEEVVRIRFIYVRKKNLYHHSCAAAAATETTRTTKMARKSGPPMMPSMMSASVITWGPTDNTLDVS